MARHSACDAASLQRACDAAVPGDVIEIGPGDFSATSTLRRRGGKFLAPIRFTFVGEGWMDGCQIPDFRWKMINGGYDDNHRAPASDSPPKPEDDDFAILQLIGCENIVIEKLRIRHAWPSIVWIKDSRFITVRGCEFEGATYAIFAKGVGTSDLLVEGNSWVQDTSESHELWRKASWVEAHGGEGGHGTRRYFNGGFISTKNIAGSIVVRRNRISDAYNGIRMKADFAARMLGDGEFLNADVHIYDNDFIRIRDNPTEPESFAYNWHVRHNRLVDCHAWFSFDGVGGGYWYYYANTGRFTSRQGVEAGERDEHTMGRVLKLSYVELDGESGDPSSRVPEYPWYVFHNSWSLRSPLIGGASATIPPKGPGPDLTANLSFLNNAFQWCAPGANCWTCEPMPPVHQFDWASSKQTVFDGSVWWSNGWPPLVTSDAPHGFEAHGVERTAPLFADPGRDDWRLAQPIGAEAIQPLRLSTPTAVITVEGADGAPLLRGAEQGAGPLRIPALEAQATVIAHRIESAARNDREPPLS